MSKKYLTSLLAVLVVFALVLSACTPAAPTEQPPAVEPNAPAEEPEAPAEEPAAPAEEPEAPAEEPAAPAEEPEAPAETGEAGVYDDVDPTGQEVIFWHNHTSSRQDSLQEIVDEFNATNEWGITVIQENQGSYGDIFNKMLPILNTPDVPTLVVAYQNQAATYQLADALVDMRPLVNSAKWGISEADQADFFEGFWAQDIFPNFDNARLGFPPNRSMEVLYYNQSWIEELGFDGPPTTPEEFKAIACAASQTPYSGATAEGPIGYELSVDASRFASWTFAFGGDVFDSETGQYTYNSEGAVKAMEFLQDLFAEGCASQVTEAYGDQTDFGAGKLMFAIGSTSGLPFYRQAVDEGAGHEWSIEAIPHTTAEPVMNVYGASVSIPKSTPEQELAAWLFVKYYTSPEVQAKWAQASEYFPVRASVAEGLADYFEAQPAYGKGFDMLKYSKFEPPTPGYDFVREMVEAAMTQIVTDPNADVQAVLDQMNEEANANLADQLSQLEP